MSENGERQNVWPNILSAKAGQMICYNSKKVHIARTMLLSHFSRKTSISCHTIMCLYELTVQFLDPDLAYGLMAHYFQAQSPQLERSGLFPKS